MSDLKYKDTKFVEYYFEFELDAVRAYEEAFEASRKTALKKYKEKLEKVKNSEFWVKKSEEYTQKREEIAKKKQIEFEDQIETLKSILDVNPADLLEDTTFRDDDGNEIKRKDLTLDAIAKLPRQVQKFIESIQVSPNLGIKVKFVSKQFALQELNRMLGYHAEIKLKLAADKQKIGQSFSPAEYDELIERRKKEKRGEA